MLLKTKFDLKNSKIISGELYKADFYRHFPTSLAAITNINNNDKNIPREDSYISLQNSYILVDFEVTHNVYANTQYAQIKQVCLVNLGPFGPFSEVKLSTSSNKHL